MYFQATFAADHQQIVTYLTNCQNRRGVLRSAVALVFAHEASDVAARNLLPYVGYWHYRSSDALDIVFPGYVGDPTAGELGAILNASFSPKAFAGVIAKFEEHMTWRYSGQPTVLILSATRHSLDEEVEFSYGEVIDFDLASVLGDEVIDSPEAFFETLMRICQRYKGEISQGLLSDILGGKSLGAALMSGILENLPVKGLRRAVGVAKYFQLRDRQRTHEE